MRQPARLRHRLLLAAGAAAALTGVLAGLGRVGFAIAWGPAYGAWHGPLMVIGLFATLIAVERAVALASPWAIAVPTTGALSGGALLLRSPLAPWMAALAAAGLVVVNVALVRRKPALFGVVTLAGSVVLSLGLAAWALGRPLVVVVPSWMAFLVLTIVGERLRWSRGVVTPRWALRALAALAATYAVSASAPALGLATAGRLMGTTLVLIASWQACFDAARHTLGQAGAPRYIAVGVLSGVAWLAVGGALLVRHGMPVAGPLYDAILHAVLLGYVFSTVFAHAPTMLAAVAGVRVPVSPVFHVPLLLLHTSLVVRIAGDLAGSLAWRRVGSAGNAVAMAVFVLVVTASGRSARRADRLVSGA